MAAGDQVVQVDEEQKQHLTKLAGSVGLATNSKTGIPDVQPAIEQEPLDEQTQKAAEDYSEEKPEQDSKLGFLFPGLRKTAGTTKAMNFLSSKVGWLKKKSGGEVGLKHGS